MEKQVIIKRGNSLADTPFTAVPTILASSYNHERVLIRNMGRRLLEDRRPHPSRSGVGHVSHLLQNFSRSIPVKIRCNVFYEPHDGDHQRTRAGRVSAADIILSSSAYRSLLDKFLCHFSMPCPIQSATSCGCASFSVSDHDVFLSEEDSGVRDRRLSRFLVKE